jgi:hypothetical protein
MLRILGVDLGQARDFTALAGLTAIPTLSELPVVTQDEETGLAADGSISIEGLPVSFDVGWLERLPLGTEYPQVVEIVADRLRRMPGAILAVDASGVGRGVVDLMSARRLNPLAVTIVGGETSRCEGRHWHVAKRDLVATITVALQHHRMRFSAKLPAHADLIRELLSFEQRTSASGNTSSGVYRSGEHDDLVLATAIGAFVAEAEFGARAQRVLAQAACDRLAEFCGQNEAGISPF